MRSYDDRPAAAYARSHLGITVITFMDILAECYENGHVACPDAYELVKCMRAAGRGGEGSGRPLLGLSAHVRRLPTLMMYTCGCIGSGGEREVDRAAPSAVVVDEQRNR